MNASTSKPRHNNLRRLAASAVSLTLAGALLTVATPAKSAQDSSNFLSAKPKRITVTESCQYDGEGVGSATAKVTFVVYPASQLYPEQRVLMTRWSLKNNNENSKAGSRPVAAGSRVGYTVRIESTDGQERLLADGDVRARGKAGELTTEPIGWNDWVTINMWIPILASRCSISIVPPVS